MSYESRRTIAGIAQLPVFEYKKRIAGKRMMFDAFELSFPLFLFIVFIQVFPVIKQ